MVRMWRADHCRGHSPCCHSRLVRNCALERGTSVRRSLTTRAPPSRRTACPVKPGDDTANGEAACERRASGRSPGVPQGSSSNGAITSRAPDQQCRGERDAGNAPASGNEGVGEHVRTRFHFGRGPLVKLRSPLKRTAPNEENSFLLPDRERRRSDR